MSPALRCLAAAALLGWAWGAACVPALPQIVRIQADLASYPQNFSVAQAPDGTVFVGNRHGVLVYEGDQWHTIELPRRSLARSLVADETGRIYVGGAGVAGHIGRQADGSPLHGKGAARSTPPQHRCLPDHRP